jgi:tRNA threonylcarbamoyl adenosine modification protein (Sua5/YciO/YrdC/YwlC family)
VSDAEVGRRSQAEGFERCMAVGGVAVFPADTVYGLACDPANRVAVQRLYLLKRRELSKPSAVMFFGLEPALDSLPELGPRTRAAVSNLLPGAVTLLLPNPAGRFPLACGDDPGTLGVRVVRSAPLDGVSWPVLQSSANRAGGSDPHRLEEVPEFIRRAADMVIDGGELPGTPSTVVDLRGYEDSGSWSVVRAGAMAEAELGSVLGGQFHFDPATYLDMITCDVPDYGRLQAELTTASGSGAERMLELGTGTGETARRLLQAHPNAFLVGIDSSAEMLAVARDSLPADRVELRVAPIEDALPEGPFDLVASALCVHHLGGRQKASLFERIRAVLRPGGRFVLADVVMPDDPADATIPLTPGFDRPSPLADQLRWLADAGFDARVSWAARDLAVVAADARDAAVVAAEARDR